MRLIKRLLVIVLLLSAFGTDHLHAQLYQEPFERTVTEGVEDAYSAVDTLFHSAMKPYHADQFVRDSIPRFRTYDRRYFNLTEVKFLKEHLIELKEDDFELYMDAVLDLNIGRDLGDTSSWQDTVQVFNNTRGLAMYGRIGDRVSFHASVFENQSQFQDWMYKYTDSLGVVPGQGRFKELESNARDYNSAWGIISIQAAKWLQVHFGQGKHFIGSGYRSMLLSDVASNYPFIRLKANFWKNRIEYTAMNAEMFNMERLPLGEVPESLFKRKGYTMRYLSVIPHPRLELGLFEAVVHQRWDSTGTKAYGWDFYQPLPFVSTAVNGLDSVNNAVVGINAKIKVSDKLFFYGQGVADQAESRFSGFQVGLRWKDFPFKTTTLRLEYNEGGAGIFTNKRNLQNYTHMNQGLAHPLGTNFKEYIVVWQQRTRKKRLWSEWRGIYQIHDGGIRGNIQSTPTELLDGTHDPGVTMISDLQFGYLMNPTSNMNAIIGWTWRDRSTNAGHLVSSFYYFTFRVALFNRYYDV